MPIQIINDNGWQKRTTDFGTQYKRGKFMIQCYFDSGIIRLFENKKMVRDYSSVKWAKKAAEYRENKNV